MRLRRSGLAIAGLIGVVAMAGGEGPPAAEGVPDVSNWNRRPPGAGDYEIVTEVSGRAGVARFMEIPPPGAGYAAARASDHIRIYDTTTVLCRIEKPDDRRPGTPVPGLIPGSPPTCARR